MLKHSIRLHKFAILMGDGNLAESKDQENAMLFSSATQAAAELRFRPRRKARIIPITLTWSSEKS